MGVADNSSKTVTHASHPMARAGIAQRIRISPQSFVDQIETPIPDSRGVVSRSIVKIVGHRYPQMKSASMSARFRFQFYFR